MGLLDELPPRALFSSLSKGERAHSALSVLITAALLPQHLRYAALLTGTELSLTKYPREVFDRRPCGGET